MREIKVQPVLLVTVVALVCAVLSLMAQVHQARIDIKSLHQRMSNLELNALNTGFPACTAEELGPKNWYSEGDAINHIPQPNELVFARGPHGTCVTTYGAFEHAWHAR